jgi:hypothetical protein
METATISGPRAAGEIARRIDVPHNTTSTHLAILNRAGLIEAERQSRSIVYRAQPEAMRELAGFLVKNCCGERPEICAPLIADLWRRAARHRVSEDAADTNDAHAAHRPHGHLGPCAAAREGHALWSLALVIRA